MTLKGKTVGRVYWAAIAMLAYYGALIGFADRLKGEVFREQMRTEDSVVFIREQDRRICPWKVYQVTAFKGNDTIYNSRPTGSKRLANWYVKRAKKSLENL